MEPKPKRAGKILEEIESGVKDLENLLENYRKAKEAGNQKKAEQIFAEIKRIAKSVLEGLERK